MLSSQVLLSVVCFGLSSVFDLEGNVPGVSFSLQFEMFAGQLTDVVAYSQARGRRGRWGVEDVDAVLVQLYHKVINHRAVATDCLRPDARIAGCQVILFYRGDKSL